MTRGVRSKEPAPRFVFGVTNLVTKLADKQKLFVKGYLANGGNATKAAHEAGYALSHAHNQGSLFLKKPEVRAAIAEKLGKTFDRLDISVERTLLELARVAYGNAADLASFNDLGDWTINLAELGDDQRALLKSIKKTDHGQTEVTTHDKMQAIQLLGKYLKMFVDVTEHNVNLGLGERILAAQLRAQQIEYQGDEDAQGKAERVRIEWDQDREGGEVVDEEVSGSSHQACS